MVETIPSFALKPEIAAATGCHSPQPRGAKRGAIAPPMIAIRLSAESSTMPKEPSANPKVESSHITTQARNRIVPALMIKPFSLSQTCIRTVLADGIWYCGSSITNGAGFPENGFVFFNMIAATRTATIPTKYMIGAIIPATSQSVT